VNRELLKKSKDSSCVLEGNNEHKCNGNENIDKTLEKTDEDIKIWDQMRCVLEMLDFIT